MGGAPSTAGDRDASAGFADSPDPIVSKSRSGPMCKAILDAQRSSCFSCNSKLICTSLSTRKNVIRSYYIHRKIRRKMMEDESFWSSDPRVLQDSEWSKISNEFTNVRPPIFPNQVNPLTPAQQTGWLPRRHNRRERVRTPARVRRRLRADRGAARPRAGHPPRPLLRPHRFPLPPALFAKRPTNGSGLG